MNEKHEAYGRNARHFASEHVSNSRLYAIFKEDLIFYRDKHERTKSGIEGDKTQENEGLNYVGGLNKNSYLFQKKLKSITNFEC